MMTMIHLMTTTDHSEKKRHTKMPRRGKTRKLWLKISFKKLDGRPTGNDVQYLREQLLASILRGDYEYPRNWNVTIEWRNKDSADMRRGEFMQEMRASRRSSIGWDTVVYNYLRSK